MHNDKRYSLFQPINWLPYAILTIAVLIAYIHTISYPFVKWDDYAYVVDNKILHGSFLSAIRHIFTSRMHANYFPLHLLSYLIEAKLFGIQPLFFHLTNILLHCANVCLVYKLFSTFNGYKPAFIAALIFAVHPVHVESVVWISERKDVLYLFFFLSSYLLLISHFQSGKNRFLLASALLYCCSLLSKSAAVVFPLIVTLTHLYLKPLTNTKKFLQKIWIFFLIAAVGIAIQVFNDDLSDVIGKQKSILKMIEIFLRYIVHILYPVGLSPRYDKLPDIPFFFIIVAVTCLVYGMIRSKHIRWGLLWMLIGLLPVLNIIPIQIIMTDRYLYLPSLGVYYIAGIFLAGLSKKLPPKIILASIITIITCYMFLTLLQTTTWSSDYTLWKKVMDSNPEDTFPLINQGLLIYDETGDASRALFWLNKAQELDPESPLLNASMGSLYYNEGDFEKAKIFFYKLISIPNARIKYPEKMLKLAHIESLEGHFQQELQILNEGLRTDLKKEFVQKIIEAKQRTQAVDIATTLIETYSRDITNIKRIIENLHVSGHFATAQRLNNAAVKKYPQEQTFILLAGIQQLMMNNEQEAVNQFNHITEKDNNAEIFLAHMMLEGSSKTSLEYAKKGISLFPDSNILLLEYGIRLARNGNDPTRAMGIYRQLMIKRPGWWHTQRMIYLRTLLQKKHAYAPLYTNRSK